jgi:regulator of protease activity HflC (stomatin/prohibitin superfamily)
MIGVFLFFVLVFAAIFDLWPWYIVDQTDVAVVKTFGKVTDRNKKANDLLDYMFEKVDSIMTKIFTKEKNVNNSKAKIMPYVDKDDLKDFAESVEKLILYTERVFINL